MIRNILMAFIVSAGLFCAVAGAATLTWDGDTAAANRQDGGGEWNTTDTNRWYNPDTSAYQAWSNSPADSAVFGVASGAAGTVTLTEPITVAGLTFSAAGSGTYTLSGSTLSLGSGATVSLTPDATINSNLAGTEGFTKSGAGILYLGGNNSALAGTVNVGAGRIAFNAGSAGSAAAGWNLSASGVIVQMATPGSGNFTVPMGALSGVSGSTLRNGGTGSGTTTFEVGALNTSTTFAGTIVDLSSLKTALTKVGSGALTLTGANTYTGLTTISAGTLQIGSGGTVGALGAGAVTNNASLVFNRSDSITVSSAISGSGSLTQSGSGTLILTGANAYTGTTTISAGTLQIGAGGTVGTLGAGPVTNNGSLVFNRSDSITVNNVISGSGSLTQSGSGTVLLGAANSYGGGTTISAGTLKLGADNALPTGTALIIGAGSSAGNLDLNGFNQTVSSLAFRSESGSATNTVTIGSGKTLTVNGANSLKLGMTGLGKTTNATFTGGGSLAVNNTGGILDVGIMNSDQNSTANAATLNVKALSAFTANVNELRVGYESRIQSNLLLSDTANTITANTIQVSNSVNNNASPGILTLGAGTNVINADNINIGLGKGDGTIKFASQVAGSPGTVTIANKAGTGGANFTIANTSNGTGAVLAGVLDLRGHSATVNAGTIALGKRGDTSASGANGTIWFDSGTFTVANLDMAHRSVTGGSGGAAGTLHIGGGTFTVNTSFKIATRVGTGGAVTGTVNLTGGTLVSNADIVESGAALANSVLTVNGGTLNMTGHAVGVDTFTYQSGLVQNLGTVSGGIALAGTGSRVFQQDTGVSGTISGAITGTGLGLTKTGPGTLTLAGANTYGGDTAVSAGTLALGADNTLPDSTNVILTGGTLDLASRNDTVTSLQLQSASGGLSNAATAGKVLQLTSTGDALVWSAARPITANLKLTGATGGNVVVGGFSGSLTLGGSLDLGGQTRVFDIADVNAGGSDLFVTAAISNGGVIKRGEGTLKYDGIATYTGLTDIQAGQLYIQVAGDHIADTAPVQISGGRLTIDSAETVGAVTLVSGSITGGAVLTSAADFDVRSGTVSGRLGGAVGLTKSTGGTVTLSNANPFTGQTLVQAGTLKLNNALALQNSPVIDVASGALLDVTGLTGGFAVGAGQTLQGNGTIQGNLNVQNGVMGPGNSAGTLTVDGNYTLAAGGDLVIEMLSDAGAGTGHDLVVVNGSGNLVTLAGDLMLELAFAPQQGTAYTILLNNTANPISGTFAGLDEGEWFKTTSTNGTVYDFAITYLGNDGNDVVLTAVPEPASLALLGLAAAGLGRYVRRRRHR